MDGLRDAVRANTNDRTANDTRIGLGLMFFGIRSQFPIFVIMLVPSTVLTLGLA